jgi:hypothetical protein
MTTHTRRPRTCPRDPPCPACPAGPHRRRGASDRRPRPCRAPHHGRAALAAPAPAGRPGDRGDGPSTGTRRADQNEPCCGVRCWSVPTRSPLSLAATIPRPARRSAYHRSRPGRCRATGRPALVRAARRRPRARRGPTGRSHGNAADGPHAQGHYRDRRVRLARPVPPSSTRPRPSAVPSVASGHLARACDRA